MESGESGAGGQGGKGGQGEQGGQGLTDQKQAAHATDVVLHPEQPRRPLLRFFGVMFVTMSNESFTSIATALPFLPNLTALTLMLNEDARLTDECFQVLSKPLLALQKLEKVHIRTWLKKSAHFEYPGIVECLRSLIHLSNTSLKGINLTIHETTAKDNKEAGACVLGSSKVIDVLKKVMTTMPVDSKIEHIFISDATPVNERIRSDMSEIAEDSGWVFCWGERGGVRMTVNRKNQKDDGSDAISSDGK